MGVNCRPFRYRGSAYSIQKTFRISALENRGHDLQRQSPPHTEQLSDFNDVRYCRAVCSQIKQGLTSGLNGAA